MKLYLLAVLMAATLTMAIMPAAAAATTTPICVRLVFSSGVAGDDGFVSRMFPNKFRVAIPAGFQAIAWDEQLVAIAQAQDIFDHSGRYAQDFGRQRTGGMTQAEEYWLVNVYSTADWVGSGWSVQTRHAGVARGQDLRATVNVQIERYDIDSGLRIDGAEGRGQDQYNAESVLALRGRGWAVALKAGESDLGLAYGKAAYRAISEATSRLKPVARCLDQEVLGPRATDEIRVHDQLIQQTQSVGVTGQVDLAFASAPTTHITVPTAKQVCVSDEIWFVTDNQVSGKFLVLAITGQTVTLAVESGRQPKDGEGFAIIKH